MISIIGTWFWVWTRHFGYGHFRLSFTNFAAYLPSGRGRGAAETMTCLQFRNLQMFNIHGLMRASLSLSLSLSHTA